MKIVYDKKQCNRGLESDPFLRSFFSNINVRPSCYNCKFKKRYRESDITIWDCFDIVRYCQEMDDDLGTTKVLIHTKKGNELFSLSKGLMKYKEVNPDELCSHNSDEMIKSIPYNKDRVEFFRDVKLMGCNVFDKWFKVNIKNRINYFARTVLLKTKLYQKVKNRKIMRGSENGRV